MTPSRPSGRTNEGGSCAWRPGSPPTGWTWWRSASPRLRPSSAGCGAPPEPVDQPGNRRRIRISRCQQPRCQCRRRSGAWSGTTTTWKVPAVIALSQPGQAYSLRAEWGCTGVTVTSKFPQRINSTPEDRPGDDGGRDGECRHDEKNVEERTLMFPKRIEPHIPDTVTGSPLDR